MGWAQVKITIQFLPQNIIIFTYEYIAVKPYSLKKIRNLKFDTFEDKIVLALKNHFSSLDLAIFKKQERYKS